eukprot:g44207.t1
MAWYSNCSGWDRNKLQKVVYTAETITEANLPSTDTIYLSYCRGKAANIIKGPPPPTPLMVSKNLSIRQKIQEFEHMQEQVRGVAMVTCMGPSYACLLEIARTTDAGVRVNTVWSWRNTADQAVSEKQESQPLEEAQDGHVTQGVGGVVKMVGNRKELLIIVYGAQVLCKSVTESTFGLTDVEEATSGATDTVDQDVGYRKRVLGPRWRLATYIHYKPTNFHRYLNYTSSHLIPVKTIPFSQFLRHHHIYSDDANFDKGASKMSNFFLNKGFPSTMVDRAHSW